MPLPNSILVRRRMPASVDNSFVMGMTIITMIMITTVINTRSSNNKSKGNDNGNANDNEAFELMMSYICAGQILSL